MYTDRASIRRGIYRLCNLSDNDAAMVEHDAASLEGINQLIEEGLYDAQEWLLRARYADPWVVVGQAVTVLGSHSDPEGKYIELEDDFLRLMGDENASALYVPGTRRRSWGRQRHGTRDGRMARGSGYWIEGGRIRLANNARPPSNLVYDYIRKPDPPEDEVPIDFPETERPLVVAFAAVHAMENNFLPAGPEMEMKILRNLERRKGMAWKRARRTTAPRRIRRPHTLAASHWFTPYDAILLPLAGLQFIHAVLNQVTSGVL